MGRNAQAKSGQIQKGAAPFKKGGAVKFPPEPATTKGKKGFDKDADGMKCGGKAKK